MTARHSKFIFLLAGMLIMSCSGNITYTGSHSMEDRVWRLMDVKSFGAHIDDTVTANNISFTIRTGSDYPFRNIFLFVSTLSPVGKKITDTLEYYLADDKGDWYGKGVGDIRELSLPYRANVYFPTPGEYTFNVQHGMRTENLKGVYDIALRIEKTKQ
ncbi:MAG: gliding motility lipoprotein GldH [Bacteroidales bacterium]|jgi:gliding motility-associated lipoprotein GldH|nr:gliding motility lipoprotein GldH [Bacteroidales bacterium]